MIYIAMYVLNIKNFESVSVIKQDDGYFAFKVSIAGVDYCGIHKLDSLNFIEIYQEYFNIIESKTSLELRDGAYVLIIPILFTSRKIEIILEAVDYRKYTATLSNKLELVKKENDKLKKELADHNYLFEILKYSVSGYLLYNVSYAIMCIMIEIFILDDG
jgi:hypothetical protein